ncbi:MAG: c-type cytochrome [Fulvivirga sp.]|nr:c-type cytochrome [Fulvivirga sp.]
MKTRSTLVMLFSMALVLVSFDHWQNDDWKVPEGAKKMKNPVQNDGEVMMIGKTLYAKHCKSCHGKNGEGDGPKADELDTFPGDFTAAAFQKQTDGALFYKTSEGRDDMPGFKKKLPSDEDRWIIVHYLRSLE